MKKENIELCSRNLSLSPNITAAFGDWFPKHFAGQLQRSSPCRNDLRYHISSGEGSSPSRPAIARMKQTIPGELLVPPGTLGVVFLFLGVTNPV